DNTRHARWACRVMGNGCRAWHRPVPGAGPRPAWSLRYNEGLKMKMHRPAVESGTPSEYDRNVSLAPPHLFRDSAPARGSDARAVIRAGSAAQRAGEGRTV